METITWVLTLEGQQTWHACSAFDSEKRNLSLISHQPIKESHDFLGASSPKVIGLFPYFPKADAD